MNCPNCDHEIKGDAKYCTVCGANIEEALKTKELEEKEKLAKEKKKKKEQEDKKKLEELRKQEQEKEEQLLKEAEKAEAIRQAKEEGIELEIIDEEPEEAEEEPKAKTEEFKVKKEENNKKEKKKKVKIKKNIFQVILGKLLFIIIVAAIICGGLYYCYRNNYLPEFAMEKAEEIDKTIQNVIQLKKDIDDLENGKEPSKDSNDYEWQLEPSIEADDIKDLTDEYSIIIKNNQYGLIDNKDGKIVLEPKYSLIEYAEYTVSALTEKGIIVKQDEKFYKLNEKFELGMEVTKTEANTKEKGGFFYSHHDSRVYYNNAANECKKANENTGKRLEICTDISIVTTTGVDAKNAALPESFTIDFEKSELGTKGYCDPEKGELIIDCNYTSALDFSEGYAAVVDGKAGFINEKGEKYKEFAFDEARSVHNKMAFVKENGKWGIVKIK